MPEKREATNEAIMSCLGEIKGTMNTLVATTNRTTWGLLGIIAAMIGVKIVGSPIFLDIAVISQMVGIMLAIGVALRLTARRNSGDAVYFTRSGWLFIVWLLVSSGVVVVAFLRDTGYLQPDIVYLARIVWGIVLTLFSWFLFQDMSLYRRVKHENNTDQCHWESK